MTEQTLPTINFNATPGIDEFQYQHLVYSAEFRNRTLIMASPGIVDQSGDPAAAPFTGARPLAVTVSPVNPLTIDIQAGNAVTPSYQLIEIDAAIPQVPIPDLTAGAIYVVAVEYVLVDSQDTRITRDNIPVPVRVDRPTNQPISGGASTLIDAVTIANLTDFNNPALFPTGRRDDLVVLGVVTVLADPTTAALSLSIDLTRTAFTTNRPWFSAVDTYHRAQLGSGVVTDHNPHGMDIQDLTSAGFTLYEQLRPLGMVIAKDNIYYGYPGKLCTELLPLNRFQVDATGQITSGVGPGPAAGGLYYVELLNLPVRMGSLYRLGEPWQPVPYQWIPGTRIIVIGALENPRQYTQPLILEYFSVAALEPPAENLVQGIQSFDVLNPVAGQEFIIAGGLALSTLVQTSLPLATLLGPIKRHYQVLCDHQGNLLLNPQPIVATLRVSDLTSNQASAVNQSPQGGLAKTFQVGLTRALKQQVLGTGTLNLQLKLNGIDGTGASVEETLQFQASQWEDQTGASVEHPLQFQVTTRQYQQLTSVTVTNTLANPHNAGPNAILSIWALTLSGSDNTSLANCASFFWTGTAGVQVRDQRLIGTTLQKLDQRDFRFPAAAPEDDGAFSQELFSILLDPPLTDPGRPTRLVLRELDDDRAFGETWNVFSTTAASGQIVVSDFASVLDGLTVAITPDKVLRFTAGIADPTTGGVAIGASTSELLTNLVATINNPGWESTWAASLGQGSNPPVILTRPRALPPGFVQNVRRRLTFGAIWTSGSIGFSINGTPVGPVSFTIDNDTTMTAIKTAINAVQLTTGVRAILLGGSPYLALLLNGPAGGQDFTIDTFVLGGGAPPISLVLGQLPVLAGTLTLTNPAGGTLDPVHLPRRYIGQLPWAYQSRALPWPGVRWDAAIQFQGNVSATISDGDLVMIAPNKVLLARRGTGATADPAQGQFLVDPASLANTFANMVAAIQHPGFASGVTAHVDGNYLILATGGVANTTLTLMLESVPGTWLLTPYAPIGSGPDNTYAFLKALHPLATAQWRFQTVEQVGNWSPWLDMPPVSPTCFRFQGPPGQSLYQVQLRLTGQPGEPNGFSLYTYTPQSSAASFAGFNARLTVLEAEVTAATGTAATLADRLVQAIELDGTPVLPADLVDIRQSPVEATPATLKERLDIMDSLLSWSGGSSSIDNPVAIIGPGGSTQLQSGPVDSYGNSQFLSTSGANLVIGGTALTPLVFRILGYGFSSPRTQQVSFTGKPSGTYYCWSDLAGVPRGLQMVASTAAMAAQGTSLLTDNTLLNLVAAGVQPGHVLVVPSILLGGQPMISPIVAVTPSTIQIRGTFPGLVASNAGYQVYSPREIGYQVGTTAPGTPTTLLLGEVTWNGVAFGPAVRSYRYLDRFVGSVVYCDTTATSNYQAAWDHNLGFLPNHFQLYFYVGNAPLDPVPKVMNPGDEYVVQSSTTTLTVRNRYSNLVARDFVGTSWTKGYVQLVI